MSRWHQLEEKRRYENREEEEVGPRFVNCESQKGKKKVKEFYFGSDGREKICRVGGKGKKRAEGRRGAGSASI